MIRQFRHGKSEIEPATAKRPRHYLFIPGSTTPWQSIYNRTNHSIHNMVSKALTAFARHGISTQSRRNPGQRLLQSECICRCHRSRPFSSSSWHSQWQKTDYKQSFGTRLRKALGETKIKWYPIPVGVGIGFLGLGQLYRVNKREKVKIRAEELEDDGYVNFGAQNGTRGQNGEGRPKRRDRIRPTGPWFVSL